MIAMFREVDNAISYLTQGIRDAAPGSQVDLTYYRHGRPGSGEPKHIRVGVGHLMSALETYCRWFPEATVIYDPDDTETPIGAIQCRCHRVQHSVCPLHCAHHDERPLVCMMVCSGDTRPTAEQRERAVELIHQRFEQHNKEHRQKHRSRKIKTRAV